MIKADLLIIDPQKDFCGPTGSLFVPGADEDCKRLATMIDRISKKVNDIHVTLDSHNFFDIAHPIYWISPKGVHPDPFTIISADDVKNGVWKPINPSLQNWSLHYVEKLEENKRYPLCIWPPHCLIGSNGYSVQDDVYAALHKWEQDNIASVDKVTKGSNYKTEHYSAVQADVPDPEDPSTQLNTRLIQTLQDVDLIGISGQALSHCVANTIRDIANNFGETNIQKFVLIEDTCSNVPGFENLGDSFVQELVGRGMKISTAAEFLK
jgi:nicotinamidase/pyrazinamidase